MLMDLFTKFGVFTFLTLTMTSNVTSENLETCEQHMCEKQNQTCCETIFYPSKSTPKYYCCFPSNLAGIMEIAGSSIGLVLLMLCVLIVTRHCKVSRRERRERAVIESQRNEDPPSFASVTDPCPPPPLYEQVVGVNKDIYISMCPLPSYAKDMEEPNKDFESPPLYHEREWDVTRVFVTMHSVEAATVVCVNCDVLVELYCDATALSSFSQPWTFVVGFSDFILKSMTTFNRF